MEIAQLHQLFLNSKGICTDTRKLQKNQLFFALKGDNFDGNKYAISAIESGADYAIIDNPKVEHPKCILVQDSLKALQALAHFHRKHLNIPIIGLTGSNGKTTTKELIDVVLSTSFNCVSTKGNFNNHIGVPLTLLGMDTKTEIGVVEMGANHLYEIEALSTITAPNYGYITNIGKAHLEGFGSEENILIGKTELYEFLRKTEGTIFINEEDEKLISKSENIKKITFSDTKSSDYSIEFISANPFVKVSFEDVEMKSNLIGNYNFTNIAAAIAMGLYFKIPKEQIKKAIESYVPSNNRSQLKKTATNELILDAYNANPSSMLAALKNFETSNADKEKVVILGDMFELGDYAKKEHQAIVDFLEESVIEKIFLAGSNFNDSKITSDKIKCFENTQELINELKGSPIKNVIILVKGSRGMALEKVVDYL